MRKWEELATSILPARGSRQPNQVVSSCSNAFPCKLLVCTARVVLAELGHDLDISYVTFKV